MPPAMGKNPNAGDKVGGIITDILHDFRTGEQKKQRGEYEIIKYFAMKKNRKREGPTSKKRKKGTVLNGGVKR